MSMSTTLLNTTAQHWQLPRPEVAAVLLRSLYCRRFIATPTWGAGIAADRAVPDRPTSGAASRQSVIELDEGVNAEGMYLSETGLQVLLSTAWWGVYGDRFTTPDGWLDEQVSLKSFDVTDPENPSLASELSVEGALVTSRRTGDEIHIISRHAPNIEGLVAYPQTEEEVANNEAILAEASDEDVFQRSELMVS